MKVSFNHDFYANEIKQVAEFKPLDSLSKSYEGSLLRAVVTQKDFIVSCADCTFPGVIFYNHNLEKVFEQKLDMSMTHAYELAYHEQHDLAALQLYVAGG